MCYVISTLPPSLEEQLKNMVFKYSLLQRRKFGPMNTQQMRLLVTSSPTPKQACWLAVSGRHVPLSASASPPCNAHNRSSSRGGCLCQHPFFTLPTKDFSRRMSASGQEKTEEAITTARARTRKTPQSCRSSRHSRGKSRLTLDSPSHSD